MVKKVLLRVFLFSLICMLFYKVSYAAGFPDIKNHWAGGPILRTVDEGLISGYPDGTFKPDRNISRVEFAAIINKIFNNSERSDIKFKDISSKDWISGEIAKASAAGYISGYNDGTVRPKAFITRQEAVKIISIAFGLEGEASDSYKGFSDAGKMQEWARNSIGVLFDRGYINGYSNGEFRPDRYLTRAEAVAVLDKAAGTIYTSGENTYQNKTVPGNFLLHTPVAVLKNVTINGDLIIPHSDSEQKLVLEDVIVKGKVYVKNNKLDSISVISGTIDEVLVASQKAQGHLKIEGSKSQIKNIFLDTASVLTISDNASVRNIELNSGAAGTVIEAIQGVTIKNGAPNIIVNGVYIDKGVTFTTSDNLQLINID